VWESWEIWSEMLMVQSLSYVILCHLLRLIQFTVQNHGTGGICWTRKSGMSGLFIPKLPTRIGSYQLIAHKISDLGHIIVMQATSG